MARDFPGTGGTCLKITNPTGVLDITGTAMTIACWFKADATTGQPALVAKHTSGSFQYVLRINGAKLTFTTTGGENGTGATTPSTGTWYHGVGVRDGTGANTIRVYLNGSLDGQGTSTVAIGDTAHDFTIGDRHDGATPFDGSIGEVAVWSVALSADEIAALAKGVSPLKVRPVGLSAYYPLWGIGAAGEPDLSGNGQHLTESGTVGVVDPAYPIGPLIPAAT